MSFDAETVHLMRRKYEEEGKACVIIADNDTYVRALTQDRRSVRCISRVNIAFLTPAEARRWRRHQAARDVSKKAPMTARPCTHCGKPRRDKSRLPTCPECRARARARRRTGGAR